MTITFVIFFVLTSLLVSQRTRAQGKTMDIRTAFEQLDAAEKEAFTARVESSTAITDLDIAAAHASSPRAATAESGPSPCPTPVFDDNYNLVTTVDGLNVSPQETSEIGDDFTLSEATIIHSFKVAWLLFECEHIFEATEFRWDLYNKVNFTDGQATGDPLDSHSYTFEEVELSFLGYVDLGFGCGVPLWQVEMVLNPPREYPAGDYVVAFGGVNPVYTQFLAQLLPTYQSSSLKASSVPPPQTWEQHPWNTATYGGNLENAFLVVGQDPDCDPVSYVPNPGPTSCPTGPIECITATPTAQPTFQPTWAPTIEKNTFVNEWRMVLPIECPCGMISMWYGDSEELPNGYQLCDGTNGTPDLQGRFPLGISRFPEGGEPTTPGDQGGNENCEVSITENNLPSHTHGITAQPTNISEGAHTHTITGTAASNGIHDHTFTLTADDDGQHNHGLTNGQTDMEPNHNHNAGTLQADNGGEHQHDLDSYFDYDPTNNPTTGMVWDQVVDGNNQKTFQTLTSGDSGSHGHGISGMTADSGGHDHGLLGNTNDDGSHTHTVSGNINNNGAHTHTVDGSTTTTGEHTHTVTGVTHPTGANNVLNIKPPYTAVHFVCCVD